jgi:Rha family phage regulatory protein
MDDNGDSEVTFSADICSEAGFAEGDYEVSFMDDIPAGNTMDEEATVASFLDDYPAGDAMDEEALIASFLDDTPACDPVDNTFDFKSLVRVDNNGQVIATSLGVAKRFGKRHDNVLAAIREIIAKNVECEENEMTLFFKESSYMNKQGKKQPYFTMDRDAFSLLVMGFTGIEAHKWKLLYIKAFNMMEAELLRLRDRDDHHDHDEYHDHSVATTEPTPLSAYDLEVQELTLVKLRSEADISKSRARIESSQAGIAKSQEDLAVFKTATAIDVLSFKAAAAKLTVMARTLKEHGVSQNSALISANKFVVKHHAIDFLETVDLPADPRGRTYTPTQLGEMLDPKLSPQKVNMILFQMGYQVKNILDYWEPTDKAQGMFEFYDVAKTTDSGVPVKQLKWFSGVLDAILKHIVTYANDIFFTGTNDAVFFTTRIKMHLDDGTGKYIVSMKATIVGNENISPFERINHV